MENRYRKLTERIHTPAGLNDQVLFEARRRTAEASPCRERQGWGRPRTKTAFTAAAAPRNWTRVLLRTAVCAVCALALVLGGFSLRPAPTAAPGTPGNTGLEETPPAQILVPTFGLTAYAAGTDTTYGPAPDGSIAFSVGEGCTTPEFGDFTGCLFQVTGENIAKVSLSIDRGGLYRYQIRENLTDEQLAEYRQAMAEGRIAPAAISQRDDGVWYMPEMTALGTGVEADYDPDARYGFWVSPEEMAPTGLGISIEAQMDADFFDGGLLTVTVTSGDGTEKTQTYRLHTGELKVEWTGDGDMTVLPELAGPDDLFVYGIYAVPED
ncbi:hypothetical protein [Oscillibacter sp.]|uniref:hypothetical protein n=1 Tax=Oscillibacter sp. TaxID=1945593 RepID=UPI00216BC1CA|nr:hypothetical protein [Oscillibacter sp.]MCI8842134.1 hypothetical protein [Oscillibacter sp.]MCI9114097.1 hypothetical protein [Oscillibacter sp.]